MKNKRVKQMICSIHLGKGEDVAFDGFHNYGDNALIGWSQLVGDGYSEWVDYPIKYRDKISLTANQLKGIE